MICRLSAVGLRGSHYFSWIDLLSHQTNIPTTSLNQTLTPVKNAVSFTSLEKIMSKRRVVEAPDVISTVKKTCPEMAVDLNKSSDTNNSADKKRNDSVPSISSALPAIRDSGTKNVSSAECLEDSGIEVTPAIGRSLARVPGMPGFLLNPPKMLSPSKFDFPASDTTIGPPGNKDALSVSNSTSGTIQNELDKKDSVSKDKDVTISDISPVASHSCGSVVHAGKPRCGEQVDKSKIVTVSVLSGSDLSSNTMDRGDTGVKTSDMNKTSNSSSSVKHDIHTDNVQGKETSTTSTKGGQAQRGQGQHLKGKMTKQVPPVVKPSKNKTKQLVAATQHTKQESLTCESSEWLRPTSGNRETPRATTSGGRKTPRATTSGGKETPRTTTSGGKETPRATTSGGKEAPRATTSGGKETPRATTSGGRETPIATTSGGKETPRTTTSGGKETQGTTSGGRETPRTTTSGGKETQGTTSGGRETPRATNSGGKETPRTTTSGGKETQRATTSGGRETQRATTSGGRETIGARGEQKQAHQIKPVSLPSYPKTRKRQFAQRSSDQAEQSGQIANAGKKNIQKEQEKDKKVMEKTENMNIKKQKKTVLPASLLKKVVKTVQENVRTISMQVVAASSSTSKSSSHNTLVLGACSKKEKSTVTEKSKQMSSDTTIESASTEDGKDVEQSGKDVEQSGKDVEQSGKDVEQSAGQSLTADGQESEANLQSVLPVECVETETPRHDELQKAKEKARKKKKKQTKRQRKSTEGDGENLLGVLPNYVPESDGRLARKKEDQVYNLSALFSGQLLNRPPAPPKSRPNYFFAVQITNPEIKTGFSTMQRGVEEACPKLKAAFVDVETAHLTLGVMHLPDEEAVARVISLMEEFRLVRQNQRLQERLAPQQNIQEQEQTPSKKGSSSLHPPTSPAPDSAQNTPASVHEKNHATVSESNSIKTVTSELDSLIIASKDSANCGETGLVGGEKGDPANTANCGETGLVGGEKGDPANSANCGETGLVDGEKGDPANSANCGETGLVGGEKGDPANSANCGETGLAGGEKGDPANSVNCGETGLAGGEKGDPANSVNCGETGLAGGEKGDPANSVNCEETGLVGGEKGEKGDPANSANCGETGLAGGEKGDPANSVNCGETGLAGGEKDDPANSANCGETGLVGGEKGDPANSANCGETGLVGGEKGDPANSANCGETGLAGGEKGDPANSANCGETGLVGGEKGEKVDPANSANCGETGLVGGEKGDPANSANCGETGLVGGEKGEKVDPANSVNCGETGLVGGEKGEKVDPANSANCGETGLVGGEKGDPANSANCGETGLVGGEKGDPANGEEPGSRLTLEVKGLDTFRDNVVFARVTEGSALNEVKAMAEHLRSKVIDLNISMDSKPFAPHITLMKMSKNLGKLKASGIRKIDSKLYQEFKETHFGTNAVTSIQLCAMIKPKQNNYYHIEHEIPLI